MDETIAKGMEPTYVAERMVLAVRQNESEVVVAPIDHRFAIQLRAIAPALYFKIMAKMAKKHSS
jgi:dehydrogenase/reductase SDR family protein 7B